MTAAHLSRRGFLRGAGGSLIALPFLESLAPRTARAAPGDLPPRMVYLWFDLGVYRDTWVPPGSGPQLELPPLLRAPLAGLEDEVTMFRRVVNFYGDSPGEGPGDHARSVGTFLTCAHQRYGTSQPRPRVALPNPPNAQPRRIRSGESHADYDAAVFTEAFEGSADQIAARLPFNRGYTLPSLQISNYGGGDSYQGDVRRHLSWLDEHRPAPRYETPRQVFDRLFENQRVVTEGPDYSAQLERSILSTVSPAVRRLKSRLGREDGQRLDRYLTEIRDLETRIAEAEAETSPPTRECDFGSRDDYPGGNVDFRRHIDLTLDLLAKAFECDVTRIVSYALPYGGFGFRQDASGRSLTRSSHNFYSHHNDDTEAREGLESISTFWVEKFAGFVARLRDREDLDGNRLLDNSMVLMGCGMMDGNGHNSHRGNASLPLLLAGRAGGRFTPGRVIDTGAPIKLADVHLSLLRPMGFDGARFGDGDGVTLPL